jgi:hypothetical protein
LAPSSQLSPQLFRQLEPLGRREGEPVPQGALASFVEASVVGSTQVFPYRLRDEEAAGSLLALGFGVQPGAQVRGQGDGEDLGSGQRVTLVNNH